MKKITIFILASALLLACIGCSKPKAPALQERYKLSIEELADLADFRWGLIQVPNECAGKEIVLTIEGSDTESSLTGFWSDWIPGSFVLFYIQGITTEKELQYGFIYYDDEGTSKVRGSMKNPIIDSKARETRIGRGRIIEPGSFIVKWSTNETYPGSYAKLGDGDYAMSIRFRTMNIKSKDKLNHQWVPPDL